MLVIGGTVSGIAAAFTAVGGATTAAGTPPSNTSVPTISGTAAQGNTLAASSGSWSGTTPMTFTYVWQRCDSAGANCANISGATSQTYTLVIADAGHKDRVTVTAHNSSGSAPANSATTAVVAGATPPANSTAPAITGSTAVGWTLSTSNGTWSGTNPITYTYQWRRCDTNGANCVDVSGATSKTYQLVSADANHKMRALVTATNSGGSGQSTSNPTNTVAVTAPGSTTAPAVTGTPTVGQTLTTTAGAWIGQGPISYTYQWERCDSSGNNCVSIASATKTTYVLVSADAAHDVRATVLAKNSAGSTAAHSNTVGPIAGGTPAPPPPPSGTTKLPNGETSIQASSVPETDRLTISSVKFTPSVVSGRAPVTATFKVIENSKYDVAGALVYVLALPYSWAKAAPEAATAADGTVSITITPTRASPKRGALVLFVRARTPKGDILAGSSTRRLVQVSLRP